MYNFTLCVYKFTLCVYNFSTQIRDLVPFFSLQKFYFVRNLIERGDYQSAFEPPDARAACDGIFRHFAYGSYLSKVW